VTSGGESGEREQWEEMLAEFRALGGVAENVRRGVGRFGIGLHVEDPSKLFRLSAPDNLLVRIEDVVFQGGVLAIKPEAQLGERERRFIEAYQARYSWGAQGRQDVRQYFDLMSGLPAAARESLIKEFQAGPRCFQVPTDTDVEQAFLMTRFIHCRGRKVLMPIIDLVNHGDGPSFQLEKGVAIEGMSDGEILVDYGARLDSFRIFLKWGFAVAAPVTFSLPVVFGTREKNVRVLSRRTEGKFANAFFQPTVSIAGGQVTLSHVMLANRRFPARPRAVFCSLLREAGMDAPEAMFDGILRHNRRKFLALLEHVENADGQGAAVLRSVIRHQLTALA
jgi:hypothetical protein